MLLRTLTCLASVAFATASTCGDEGMWLFNDLPRSYLQENYGFAPTDAWAEHVRLASVRFNSGGSASFVSSNGLVITNHHVAADTLHKISTKDNNYFRDGFLANSLEEEIKAPDLELNQLVSIEDVTDRVNAAVSAEMSVSDAAKARRAVMAEIENASLEETKLRSDVVTLFGGAKYHLYRYKKYTDVRVVFAPEDAIAFFGGDADNFEYPRYCLDVCLFRVYQDGQPAKIDHFLKWSADGAQDNELIFVSGNPGRTQRIFTNAALKYLRDDRLPFVLDQLRRGEVLLQQFSLEGEEQQRRARDRLLGVQNARKAYTGMLQGLQNPVFMQSKLAAERDLLSKLDPQQAAAWKEIEDIQTVKRDLLRQTASFRSRYYEIAEELVLMAAEDAKPSADRLREYRDSNRESLEQDLFSPAPIYADLETVRLADAVGMLVERRGGDDPLVREVLQGKSPRQRAVELITGTKLTDIDVRRELAKAAKAKIDSSSDPMIQLAMLLEPEYRALREQRDEIEERERQAYAKITEATNQVMGTGGYPDATFTLRLALGTVKGYEEDGQVIPPWTTMGGAFEHEAAHGGKQPWALPESWKNAKDKINHNIPFNFVSTADIIGGNSGSPVINRNAEFVGIIFDGNIQSLTADYFYSDIQGRAVSVHSSAIRAALRNIYGAEALADQLGK